jgi:putative intracellular protease/amidase
MKRKRRLPAGVKELDLAALRLPGGARTENKRAQIPNLVEISKHRGKKG